jgi:hypothetical protein
MITQTHTTFGDIGLFSSRLMAGYAMRPYQLEAARAIAGSVMAGRGDQFAVAFARQAGKDEMLAQLLAYLLTRNALRGGSVVVAAPTLRPQALISRNRLLARLRGIPAFARWTSTEGATVRVGRASATFLSAAKTANARGQTASLALVANETQDVDPERWDAVFDPMAASTNAPTLVTASRSPPWSKGPLGVSPNSPSHHVVPSGHGGLTSTQNRAWPTPCFSTVTRSPIRFRNSRFPS